MNRMLTLEEAIKHCEEKANELSEKCTIMQIDSKGMEVYKCAEEHRQLAGWLKLLKEIQDSGDCNVCSVKKYCRYVPEIGDKVRYNCPFYNGRIWHEGLDSLER